MKNLILFILFFPFIGLSQSKFDPIREKLMQNKTYEFVYRFENNYAVFSTFDHTMGVMDSLGNVIIPPVYTYVGNRRARNNLYEVTIYENKKHSSGFVDIKGNIRIPIIYDYVYYVGSGMISVRKDGKYGVLDTLNRPILPIDYDQISFDHPFIIARSNGTYSLYDGKGSLINNLQFTNITRFRNDRAIITFPDTSTAIIDLKGNIVLQPIQRHAFEWILNDSLYLVRNILTSRVGVVNAMAEFTIPCKYEEIDQVKSFFIARSINKYGLITSTDSILKPFLFDRMYRSYFNSAEDGGHRRLGENFKVAKKGLSGVINPFMEDEVIPIQYKRISDLFDKYYMVENAENMNGLYLENGEKVLNEEYTFYNDYKNTIFATKNNKPLLITIEGGKPGDIEVSADAFVEFSHDGDEHEYGYQAFKSNGKYGVMDYKNNISIPAEYDFIENIYYSNEFIVKKNNKFGVINTDNKMVVEIEWDKYKWLHESILFTKENPTIQKYYDILFVVDEEPPPIILPD